jgi:hypothetical protein
MLLIFLALVFLPWWTWLILGFYLTLLATVRDPPPA